MTRRSFLRIGGLGMGGLSLPDVLRAEAQRGRGASSKALIMILLPGGPPHLDMYDLKPGAPAEVRGEFRPIPTAVPGIEIGELLPGMARIMDRLVLVRSLVGGRDDHNCHQCLTGWESHPRQDDSPDIPGYPEGGWPSIGAVASRLMGPTDPAVPPFVSLAPPRAESMTRALLNQAGYLGAGDTGFEPLKMAQGGIVLENTRLDRLADRRTLLASLDGFRRRVESDRMMENLDTFTAQAFSILTSSRVAEALDLDREDPAIRRRYGFAAGSTPENGGPKLLEQFLVVRRLVDAGVRCVTLAFSRWPLERESRGGHNWDWHADNFTKARKTLPLLDRGITALIEDLESRGRLQDVSIVAWGEFGRSPRINASAGRDHWPQVGACLLAGGGIRTGQVIGATSKLGEYAVDRPIHFRDVFATLYHHLGIDASRIILHDRGGRPHALLDERKPIRELV